MAIRTGIFARLPDPSPWRPITDLVDLAHLGKLAEELNEAGAVVARCIIQGTEGVDPKTGELNVTNLQNELADVRAAIDLVIRRFGLSPLAMDARKKLKIDHRERWHKKLRGMS